MVDNCGTKLSFRLLVESFCQPLLALLLLSQRFPIELACLILIHSASQRRLGASGRVEPRDGLRCLREIESSSLIYGSLWGKEFPISSLIAISAQGVRECVRVDVLSAPSGISRNLPQFPPKP